MEIGHTEPCQRRVRVVHAGVVAADTCEALYVWEKPYYPIWYLPTASVRSDLLPEGSCGVGLGIDGYVRIEWGSVDAWFEEDEEAFGHPVDPYHRVDVRDSSRRVVVKIGETVVADSVRPKLVFETGMPVRYYLPPLDVRLDLLTPSDTKTVCPYKGFASYWNLTIDGATMPDVVWGYPHPIPESYKLAGLLCFYNERVTIEVD